MRLVMGSRLVGSDHRACRQFWEDYGATEVMRLLGMCVCALVRNSISFRLGTVCLGRKSGLLPSNCIRRNEQRCAVLTIVEVIRVPPPPVLERNEGRIWSTGVQEWL